MQGCSRGEMRSHLLNFRIPTAPSQSHLPVGGQDEDFGVESPLFGTERSPHATAPQPSQTQIPDIFFSFLCSQEIHFSWEVKVSRGSS